MKHLLLTTIAAVVLVGCGESQELSEADRALLKTAQAGNIEAVKQHLADGADVNAKNKYGRTPLDEAARKGHEEIVELLIAKGADVNVVDGADTPLFWARGETADLLRKHGGKTGEELN